MLKTIAKANFERELHVTKEEIADQLWVIAQVNCPNPAFAGCTRSKLDMPEIRKAVRKLVNQRFFIYLQANPGQAQRWLQAYDKNHVV